MTDTPRPFRIRPDQSVAAKAKQTLMILSNELRLAVYRQPFQIGDVPQREALLHLLNTEFGTTIPLPKKGRAVVYLVACEDNSGAQPRRVPFLVHEDEVLPFVVGYAFAHPRGGFDAARRVSYRADMLPLP
jgi:hypothetical protein